MNSMKTLSHCFRCRHVHDELIIECTKNVPPKVLCKQMALVPNWFTVIQLRVIGHMTKFYKKDFIKIAAISLSLESRFIQIL